MRVLSSFFCGWAFVTFATNLALSGVLADAVEEGPDVVPTGQSIPPTFDLGGFLEGIGKHVEDASKKVESIIADATSGLELPDIAYGVVNMLGPVAQTYAESLFSSSGPLTGRISILQKIRSLETAMNTTIATARRLEAVVQRISDEEGISTERLIEELNGVYDDALLKAAEEYALSDQAPGHELREELTGSVLVGVGRGLSGIATALGVPEDTSRDLQIAFESLAPHIKSLVVTVGDLAEQHPFLFNLAVILIPGDLLFFGPLLSLFGFGTRQGGIASHGVRLFWNLLGQDDPTHSSSLDATMLLRIAAMHGYDAETVADIRK